RKSYRLGQPMKYIDKMMTPRTECIEGYEKLKSEFDQLESPEFREHWFYRAKLLLVKRCSYRYLILLKLAKEHIRKGRDSGIDRITSVRITNSNSSILSKEKTPT
ncbi:hypothetical protein KAW18_18500, partial [candidate division WOR-3 bacterium]|nr:hypothetical protein [candidate division WOR-3 bacterium]